MPTGSVIRRYELPLNGEIFCFTLCRVPRRRHVHLVVEDSGELQVRAPYRYSVEEAATLITAHADWIVKKLALVRDRVAARPVLASGCELPLLGDRLVLNVNPCEQIDLFASAGGVKLGEVLRVDRELQLRARSRDRNDVRELLEQWYRREAKDRLVPLLYETASRIGLMPKQVSIRGQKTCWGSCSSNGTISLNWRLLLLPRELAEYVLIHELCHLRFLDHSASFWTLVERWIPDFRKRRALLKNAQQGLAL